MSEPKTRALKWLRGWDKGVSSELIWRHMMGETPERIDIPHDPADFGRCYRLLALVPEWRRRMPSLARRYPMWRPFVKAWDELTMLFEQESPNRTCPRLYARMKQLRGIK